MIIILGSSGLIGSQLKEKFLAQGKTIWAPTRDELMLLKKGKEEFDCKSQSSRDYENILMYFRQATILISTIGIAPGLAEVAQREVYQLQKLILTIALEHQIPTIISFSALSHAQSDAIPYLHYKYLLDEFLLNYKSSPENIDKSRLKRYVIKPSLVFSEVGESTRFFQRLAGFPIIGLPKLAIDPGKSIEAHQYEVTPIVLKELIEFVMTLLVQNVPSGVFEVGSHRYRLGEYLQSFNPDLKIVSIPEFVFKNMMSILKPIWPGITGRYAAMLLSAGSTPISDDFERIMGRKTARIIPMITQDKRR